MFLVKLAACWAPFDLCVVLFKAFTICEFSSYALWLSAPGFARVFKVEGFVAAAWVTFVLAS